VVSARVNLLTKTEQFDDAAWNKVGSTISANTAIAPDGTLTADKIVESALNERHAVSSVANIAVPGTLNTFSIRAKAGERSRLRFSMAGTGNGDWAWFDLLAVTATVGSNTANGLTCSITADAQGFYVLTVNMTPANAANNIWGMLSNDVTPSRLAGYLGDGTSGLFVWGADARVANQGVNLPAYQRVNTSTDYDSTGFPVYIKPNGSNQFMVTNSINFTATDKMTVWQGIRKLSSGVSVPMEFSTNVDTNASAFNLASDAAAANNWYFSSGSIAQGLIYASATTYAAPITNVIAVSYNRAVTGSGQITPRVNALTPTLAFTGTGSTGNFGNYPAYFFARGGTTLFFSGHDYGSIARGAASTAAQIANGETYINSKTKAF
jgi:hypothetical protein